MNNNDANRATKEINAENPVKISRILPEQSESPVSENDWKTLFDVNLFFPMIYWILLNNK